MSLSVRSLSPGISTWTTVPGEWDAGEEERRRGERGGGGGGEEFYSIAHGKVDWSSFTKHPFYTPGSPENSRAQEGAMGDKGQ